MSNKITRYFEERNETAKARAESVVGKVGNYFRDKKITARYVDDLPPATIMKNSHSKHAKAVRDLGKNRPAQRRYVKGVLQTRLAQLEAEGQDQSAGYIKKKLEKYAND